MTFRRLDSVVAELLAKITARHIAQCDDDGPTHPARSSALSPANLQPSHWVNPDALIGEGGSDDGIGGDRGAT